MADLSQKADVLEHLKKHGKITSMEAIKNYGATRLSAIIYDLRHRDGYDIATDNFGNSALLCICEICACVCTGAVSAMPYAALAMKILFASVPLELVRELTKKFRHVSFHFFTARLCGEPTLYSPLAHALKVLVFISTIKLKHSSVGNTLYLVHSLLYILNNWSNSSISSLLGFGILSPIYSIKSVKYSVTLSVSPARSVSMYSSTNANIWLLYTSIPCDTVVVFFGIRSPLLPGTNKKGHSKQRLIIKAYCL